ncbi:MAG: hypothetical protein ACYCW9_06805 [Thermoplasmata archaeon]
MDGTGLLRIAGFAILGIGLVTASGFDLRYREVPDPIWLGMGVVGIGLGALTAAPLGVVPTALWIVVGALVIEPTIPWDRRLAPAAGRWSGWIEPLAYLGVGLLLLVAALLGGVGPGRVLPWSGVAVYLTVLLARGLFESRIFGGGADAKALMVVALFLPFGIVPLLPSPSIATTLLTSLPFSVTVLLNALILSLGVPAYLGLRNLRRGEFRWDRGDRGFQRYRLPVSEIPRRFVWVDDPEVGVRTMESEAENSEQDLQIRTEARDRLVRLGVPEVWVAPQLPFVVLISAGVFVGILAGNLLFLFWGVL